MSYYSEIDRQIRAFNGDSNDSKDVAIKMLSSINRFLKRCHNLFLVFVCDPKQYLDG